MTPTRWSPHITTPWRLPFVLTALLLLAVPGRTQPVHIPGGVIEELRVGDQTRSYRLEPPPPGASGARVPVIIFLHGSNTFITDPIPTRFDIPFETLPGREPALIVRPQGIGGHWNSGPPGPLTWHQTIRRWIGLDQPPPGDDVAFLRALIDRVIADDHGDKARVYVAGVSAGGAMSIRVACELSDKVAAVAVVAATARTALLPHCLDTRPIPVLLMASTTDPAVPYSGWPGPWGTRSAPQTVAYFSRRDGCTTRTEQPLPHADLTIDSTVSLIRYAGCKDGADVLFYRVDGSGHSVPSLDPPEPGDWAESGARNRDIDTATVVWDFFRGRRLN